MYPDAGGQHMFRCTSRLAALIAVLFGLSLLFAGSAPTLGADDPAPSKLDGLLKERLETLREVAKLASEAYKSGGGSFADVREAMRQVLEAELEQCTTDKERIAVLEKVVADAKKWEGFAEESVKAGVVPARTALKARADRLQAEIALERLRNKPAARPAPEGQGQVALAEKQVAIKRAAVKVAEGQYRIALAKLTAIKASVSEAQAAEAFAEKQLKRFEALLAQNTIPTQIVDEHRAQFEAARSRRVAAEGSVQEGEALVQVEQARVMVAQLEVEEAELRLKQLKVSPER
jgi:hypothetical protein